MKIFAKNILVAVVMGGVVVFSGLLVTHAQGADTSPPTMPTGLTATVTASSQISITWDASTDNVGVVGYYVYRNGTEIANTGALSYTDIVSPGLYNYTVAAYDAAGNVSLQSAPVTLTFVADTTPPSAPTGLSATPSYTASLQVALSWSASTDNVGVAGYYVYRNNIKLYTSTPITGTTFTDTVMSTGSYVYTVVAYDAAGNVSNHSAAVTANVVIDTQPPSTPSNLTATIISPYQINLSWGPSIDNVSVAGYTVYRNGAQVATVTTPSYSDTGLSSSTQYTYMVTAYDEVNNTSPFSPTVMATTPTIFDTIPPTTPLNFNGTAASDSQVNLYWSASTDNVGVAGYYIYRNGTQLGDTTSTSYIDTGLSPSTLYLYNVAAFDAAGNISPQSATTSIATLAAPGTLGTAASSGSVSTTTNASTTASTLSTSSSTPVVGTSSPEFTQPLYPGLRSAQVQALQSLLIAKNYLVASGDTGYFGSLTEAALKQFQCDQNIVCTGSSSTTGWGLVGAKTRSVLNQVVGGGSSESSQATTTSAGVSSSNSTSSQSLAAELQMLEAELTQLEQQAQAPTL